MSTASLTERELDVVRLTAHGLSTGEIGARLSISRETVKSHRKGIISKLGARNSTHAVAIICMNAPELMR